MVCKLTLTYTTRPLMNVFPSIILLSQDQLLEELLAQLLSSEGFRFRGAADAVQVLDLCSSSDGAPGVVLIDAIENSDRALALLEDSACTDRLGPTVLLLLAGSTTASEVLQHSRLTAVVRVPLSAEALVEELRSHARKATLTAPGAAAVERVRSPSVSYPKSALRV